MPVAQADDEDNVEEGSWSQATAGHPKHAESHAAGPHRPHGVARGDAGIREGLCGSSGCAALVRVCSSQLALGFSLS